MPPTWKEAMAEWSEEEWTALQAMYKNLHPVMVEMEHFIVYKDIADRITSTGIPVYIPKSRKEINPLDKHLVERLSLRIIPIILTVHVECIVQSLRDLYPQPRCIFTLKHIEISNKDLDIVASEYTSPKSVIKSPVDLSSTSIDSSALAMEEIKVSIYNIVNQLKAEDIGETIHPISVSKFTSAVSISSNITITILRISI